MITTPTRKAKLVSSIFTWSIWSFPCHFCLLTDAGFLPTKMALLKLCFEEVFLQVARLVVAQMLERKWYDPERCGKKPSRSCWSDRWRDADIFCWICVLFGFLRWLKDQVSHHHQASRKPDGSGDPQASEDNWFCRFSHLSKNLTVVTLVTFGLGWIQFGIVPSTARISNSQGYGPMDVFVCCTPKQVAFQPTILGPYSCCMTFASWKFNLPSGKV